MKHLDIVAELMLRTEINRIHMVVWSWQRQSETTARFRHKVVTHEHDTSKFKFLYEWLAYEQIEVVFIDLSALPTSHGAISEGIDQFPECTFPHDVCVLQWVYIRQFLKVFLLIRSV